MSSISEVCKVRLDLDSFNIKGNTDTKEMDVAMHGCGQDKLALTGGSGTLPSICGSNSGQHGEFALLGRVNFFRVE